LKNKEYIIVTTDTNVTPIIGTKTSDQLKIC